jgi:hypothetical protein
MNVVYYIVYMLLYVCMFSIVLILYHIDDIEIERIIIRSIIIIKIKL